MKLGEMYMIYIEIKEQQDWIYHFFFSLTLNQPILNPNKHF